METDYPSYAQPDWSPDRTMVAAMGGTGTYVRSVHGNEFGQELWSTGSSGLQGNPQPAWSPDGNCMAHVKSNGDGTTQDLYVATADGSAHRRLTENLIINSKIA